MTIAIPVSMKVMFFRAEPFVILVDADRTALIRVGKKRYESIVSPDRHGTYLDRLAGTAGAFAAYADELAAQPLESVVAQCPKSILIKNEQVKSFRLYVRSDADRERSESPYAFEIVTAGRTYRGSVDRGTDSAGKSEALKGIFGARFL